jgi:hypothetical protein
MLSGELEQRQPGSKYKKTFIDDLTPWDLFIAI